MNDSAPRTVLGEGKFLRLVSLGGWESVERSRGAGVVAVVAVTVDGRVILVEQFRPAVGANVVELPAGLAGDGAEFSGESPAEAARRELQEETGYSAETFVELGTFASSAGLSNESVTFFLAKSPSRTGPGGGDGSERITVHEIPLSEVDEWLKEAAGSGRMIDARVYTGLYFLETAPR